MTAADELKARIDTIEESYEFFLAYAAQGVAGDQASKSSGQVREYLNRTEAALPELADLFTKMVKEREPADSGRYETFIDVLRRDANDALAAIQLVLAQSAITSQMVDNLNALIHLRALLTDVFLIDEILSPRPAGGATLPTGG
ncbi:MAG: hypothetical protein V3T48_02780 [Vicinamibacterales bacterium]